ncbi:MAG: thiol peroxidase [Prevotella sp.]|nr:thiol peroxidase [Bacteroides sp.]MCM1367095.1 thiol peroxidase [Prevotella sp.]MCM1437360.1 thiol peroxidase [Prevotella sp.]
MVTQKLKDITMHTCGDLPKVGSEAPDFTLTAQDLSDITLKEYKGKRVVLNIFPSLDTDVCAASVRHFNQEVAELPDTTVLCVSMDLPFAAARFCSINGIENVRTASAFRSDFGKIYGVEIVDGPMRGLLARAVIVIDKDGKIMGVSYKENIAEEPDYDYVKNLLK